MERREWRNESRIVHFLLNMVKICLASLRAPVTCSHLTFWWIISTFQNTPGCPDQILISVWLREKISVRARGSSDLWLSPSRCEAEAQLSLTLREQETDQSDIKCHTSGAKLTLNSPLLSLLYINIKHFPFLYLWVSVSICYPSDINNSINTLVLLPCHSPVSQSHDTQMIHHI